MSTLLIIFFVILIAMSIANGMNRRKTLRIVAPKSLRGARVQAKKFCALSRLFLPRLRGDHLVLPTITGDGVLYL